MNTHLTESDREALWLAHELREEMRLALDNRGAGSVPAVSPFVDSAGRPSVLVRMDGETARALALILGEHRNRFPGARRTDGTPVPPQEMLAPPRR